MRAQQQSEAAKAASMSNESSTDRLTKNSSSLSSSSSQPKSEEQGHRHRRVKSEPRFSADDEKATKKRVALVIRPATHNTSTLRDKAKEQRVSTSPLRRCRTADEEQCKIVISKPVFKKSNAAKKVDKNMCPLKETESKHLSSTEERKLERSYSTGPCPESLGAGGVPFSRSQSEQLAVQFTEKAERAQSPPRPATLRRAVSDVPKSSMDIKHLHLPPIKPAPKGAHEIPGVVYGSSSCKQLLGFHGRPLGNIPTGLAASQDQLDPDAR